MVDACISRTTSDSVIFGTKTISIIFRTMTGHWSYYFWNSDSFVVIFGTVTDCCIFQTARRKKGFEGKDGEVYFTV